MRNGHFFGQSHKHKKFYFKASDSFLRETASHRSPEISPLEKNSKSAFSRWRHFLRKFTMFDTVFSGPHNGSCSSTPPGSFFWMMLALTKLFLPRNTRLSLVSPKLGKCNISLLLLLVCDRILTSNKRRSRSQNCLLSFWWSWRSYCINIAVFYSIVNEIEIVQIQT